MRGILRARRGRLRGSTPRGKRATLGRAWALRPGVIRPGHPGGTAPLITTVGDYIFMLPFGDNVQAAVAAELGMSVESVYKARSRCLEWLREAAEKLSAAYEAD